MNTTPIIESKQALEDKINDLVSAYREEYDISDIVVNTRIRKFYFNSPVIEGMEIQTNATITIHENGADIVIK